MGSRYGGDFLGAVGLFLLTLFRIRYWIIAHIPLNLRVGITSGIGLFIAMMGLKIPVLLFLTTIPSSLSVILLLIMCY